MDKMSWVRIKRNFAVEAVNLNCNLISEIFVESVLVHVLKCH